MHQWEGLRYDSDLLVTAVLLEATSQTQTIAQGVPVMKGRAIVAFGNEWTGHGISPALPAYHPGCASVGFQDETGGEFAALGFQRQSPYFEQSGSGGLGPGSGFYATLESQVGAFLNRIEVDLFGCGELGIDSIALPSSNLEGLMMLSGTTLETEIGYTTFSGTGAHSVTGLSFQPDLVLFSYFGHASFGPPPVSIGDKATLCFGAFDGTNQWAVATQSGGYLTGGGRNSRASQSRVVIDPTRNPIGAVSLDSDGFTLNWYGPNSGIVMYHAIHDPAGHFACGMGTEGDTSFTPGFTPDMVLFGNSGVTALDTNQSGGSFGVGGCDQLLRQYGGWGGGGGIEKNRVYWNTSALPMAKHPNSAYPALDAEAEVTAMGSTVDLNWTTGGSGGMRFGWVAAALSDATGFDGCGFIPQIYRWLKR